MNSSGKRNEHGSHSPNGAKGTGAPKNASPNTVNSKQNTINRAAGAQRPASSARKPKKSAKRGLFGKKSAGKKAQVRKAGQNGQAQPIRQPQNTAKAPAPKQSLKHSSNQAPKAQTPPRAVSRKASAVAEKAMNTKHAAPTRTRYRGGNYVLYYLLFAVILIVVLVVLANTVLFNCKTIEVNGAVRYQAEDIIQAASLHKGDNLLHVDKQKAAERIESELVYVESAAVETSFPTKIVITVTEAERWFCLNQSGVLAVISRGGKIIEKGSGDGLVVVIGYEAQSLETGSRISSKVEGKQDIPERILNAADKAGVSDIDSIDITDRYSIVMTVDGRIRLELGDITDMETKMLVAYELIENKIAPNENVTVLLSNPEKVAVHTNHPEEQSSDSQTDEPNSDLSSNEPENSTSE